MTNRISRFFLVTAIFMGAALAQDLATQSWRVGDHEATIVFGPPHPAPAVTGAPYSADQVQDYAPTGSSNVIGHFYRDSQGRTRTEQMGKPAPVWLVQILDPVAGFAYTLDEQNKVAHRMTLPRASGARNQARMPGTVESLGTKTIEGVAAAGTRVTGRALTIETWVSDELHETLVTKSSNGYSTMLVNLSRVEPDPARFQPPADYAVVDEQEGFALKLRFE